MTAPLLWIVLPLAVGGLALFLPGERPKVLVGGLTAFLLCVIALIVPIDSALLIGPLSIKISSSVQVLGRNLVLGPPDGALLAILYGLAAMWFFGAEAAGVANRLVPLGLAIVALLVASIAVEPFLFAAIFIEIAVLLAVPMLSPQGQVPGRGVLRFLIYQTLAMPFILFAGWMLAGVESSPGDLALTIQSATMLGMGFAFLLAVFPLYSWIPLIGEETSPYVAGFLFWALPTVTIIFGIGFLDRYAWLRTSPELSESLAAAGILMVVTGGWWSAFQRHLGRMMAYAAIAETGFVIMGLSVIPASVSIEVIFLHLIPRGLGLAIWTFALSVLRTNAGSLHFKDLQGSARAYPFACAGLILAHLSTAGFPLLAGFSARLALWEGLAQASLGLSFWLLIGLVGLLISAIRTLSVLVMAPEKLPWGWNESRLQLALLGAGVAALFLFGVFPQLLRPFLEDLPLMFTHLG
jgi:formate hydrogenlyase subunit 3/multisubunit Na+/H+ antiporter MnhD subunit